MTDETHLIDIVDIGPGVFPSASNEVMITTSERKGKRSIDDSFCLSLIKASDFPKPTFTGRFSTNMWTSSHEEGWFIGESAADQSIVSKLERFKERVGNFYSVNQGLRTGNNEKYLSDVQKDPQWRLVVAGKDVTRYHPLKPTTWVNYDRNVLDAPRDAAIWEAPEKLVFQEVRNITLRRRLVGVYDNKKICSLQTTNVVTSL